MIAVWVVLGVVLYVVTYWLTARALYLSARRHYPALYDNSEYDYRDAPHGDDYVAAAVLALVFPIMLLWSVAWLLVLRFRSDPRARWRSQRDRLAEAERALARERSKRERIMAELNREYDTGASP